MIYTIELVCTYPKARCVYSYILSCSTGDSMVKLYRNLWSSSTSFSYGPIWNIPAKCGILISIEGQGCLGEVQKFACELVTSKWDSSYEELLSPTDLRPLQDRRLDFKLVLMFKVVHSLCYILPGMIHWHTEWNVGAAGTPTHTIVKWKNILDNSTITGPSYKLSM